MFTVMITALLDFCAAQNQAGDVLSATLTSATDAWARCSSTDGAPRLKKEGGGVPYEYARYTSTCARGAKGMMG